MRIALHRSSSAPSSSPGPLASRRRHGLAAAVARGLLAHGAQAETAAAEPERPRPVASVLATLLLPSVSVTLKAIPWVDVSVGFMYALAAAGLHVDAGLRVPISDGRTAVRVADGSLQFQGWTVTLSGLGGWWDGATLGGRWRGAHAALRLDASDWYTDHFAFTATATVEGVFDADNQWRVAPLVRLGGGVSF